jgi:hypothetical protein
VQVPEWQLNTAAWFKKQLAAYEVEAKNAHPRTKWTDTRGLQAAALAMQYSYFNQPAAVISRESLCKVIAADMWAKEKEKTDNPEGPMWVGWTGVRDKLGNLGIVWAEEQSREEAETGTVQGGAQAENLLQLKQYIVEGFKKDKADREISKKNAEAHRADLAVQDARGAALMAQAEQGLQRVDENLEDDVVELKTSKKRKSETPANANKKLLSSVNGMVESINTRGTALLAVMERSSKESLDVARLQTKLKEDIAAKRLEVEMLRHQQHLEEMREQSRQQAEHHKQQMEQQRMQLDANNQMLQAFILSMRQPARTPPTQ